MNLLKIRKTKVMLEELNYLSHIDSIISYKSKYYTSYGDNLGGNRLEITKEFDNVSYTFRMSLDNSSSYLNFTIDNINFKSWLLQNKEKSNDMLLKILPIIINIFKQDIVQAADYYLLNENTDIKIFLPNQKYTPKWSEIKNSNNRRLDCWSGYFNLYDLICDVTTNLKELAIVCIPIYLIYCLLSLYRVI